MLDLRYVPSSSDFSSSILRRPEESSFSIFLYEGLHARESITSDSGELSVSAIVVLCPRMHYNLILLWCNCFHGHLPYICPHMLFPATAAHYYYIRNQCFAPSLFSTLFIPPWRVYIVDVFTDYGWKEVVMQRLGDCPGNPATADPWSHPCQTWCSFMAFMPMWRAYYAFWCCIFMCPHVSLHIVCFMCFFLGCLVFVLSYLILFVFIFFLFHFKF